MVEYRRHLHRLIDDFFKTEERGTLHDIREYIESRMGSTHNTPTNRELAGNLRRLGYGGVGYTFGWDGISRRRPFKIYGRLGP